MATLAAAESLDELKDLYRHYAAIHHPDKGGCTSRMQSLNHQYREMKKRLKNRRMMRAHAPTVFPVFEWATSFMLMPHVLKCLRLANTPFVSSPLGAADKPPLTNVQG